MTWFDRDGETIAAACALPRVMALRQVESTMDAADAAAAEGAPAGTLVLAEEQRAGRGRTGKAWRSAARAGIYMTLIERPRDLRAVEVLSLRVGLALAPVLERWLPHPVQLKWPNDLYVGGRKLAGVLIEARWRDGQPDWVSIGMGINLRQPQLADGTPVAEATALEPADPHAVVQAAIASVRAAAQQSGPLTDAELADFAARDFAFGRAVASPAIGTARGISRDGALRIESGTGLREHRAGSLIFAST